MFFFTLSIKSFDFYFTRKAVDLVLQLLSFLEIHDFTLLNLPQKKKKITVLRSPHIDKKSREQFQLETKKTLLFFKTPSQKRGLLLMELVKHLVVAGVEIQLVTRYSKYL